MFTVQEEVVGGAGVAAYQVKPDVALVLEGQLLPMSRGRIPIGTPRPYAAALTVMDRSVIPHPHLVRELIELAEKAPFRIRFGAQIQAALMQDRSSSQLGSKGGSDRRALPLYSQRCLSNE